MGEMVKSLAFDVVYRQKRDGWTYHQKANLINVLKAELEKSDD